MSLKKGDLKGAAEYFHKAAVSSQLDFTVLENVLNSLIAAKGFDEADKLLKLIPNSDRSSDSFKKFDFMVSSKKEAPFKVIEKGKKLLKEGLKDADVALTVTVNLAVTF